MYLTEEQAAMKICPFLTVVCPEPPRMNVPEELKIPQSVIRSGGYISAVEQDNPYQPFATCQGSQCMMWQWLTGASIQKGRCALTAGS